MGRALICILAAWAIMAFTENVYPSVHEIHAAWRFLAALLIFAGCWKAIGK